MAQCRLYSEASSGCQRLLAVTGDKGKQNDVIVCGSVQNAKQHVIYFGGDVQDYEENMKIFSPKYLKWNLESTALKLHTQFEDSCVFVIKPSKMIQQSLSIYKNFLEFNSSGNPVFSSDSGCIQQCYQLYNNAILAATNDSTNNNVDNSHIYDTPLTLIGFSKGCVVLNQFVYEIKHSKCQENTNAFLSKLSAIYWLDSGHNGKGNVWITEDESLKELAELRDYIERMTINNPLNSHNWNLESTAKLILSKFPDAAVFIIKPATMFLKTFSVYKNFLSFDEDMVPEFTKNFGSLLHLHSLYKEAKIKALQTEQNGCHGNGGDDGCSTTTPSDMYTVDETVLNKVVPIKLVGFSKGCVVLNQFVYELDHFKDDISLRLFVSSISEMYWLDGGHLGSSGAYVTEDEYLKSLKNLGCKILVHVTPYMMKDPRRNWIGKEVEIFIDKLKTLEANVIEYRHFMDEPGSIENHFKVLTLI